MPKVTLESIAEDNDIVLIDSNIIGCASTVMGKGKGRIDLFFSPLDELKAIEYNFLRTLKTIEKNPNIYTTKEVIKECEKMKRAYESISNKVNKKNKINSNERKKEIGECANLLNESLNLLKQRKIYQGQSVIYYPLEKITLEVARLMPRFSKNIRHYKKKDLSVITDELIVANAFSLSISSEKNKKTAVVSYDTRIRPLITGTYSLLMSKQLFPQNKDLVDKMLKNEITSYGMCRSNVIQVGKFSKHNVMRLVREDISIENNLFLYRTIEKLIINAKNFDFRVA